jgi:hypothetical protein
MALTSPQPKMPLPVTKASTETGDDVINGDLVVLPVVLPDPSYPGFYPDQMPSPTETQQLSALAATFKSKDVKDWLTYELLHYIEKVFPLAHDFSYDPSGDKVFDLDAFRTKVGSFFVLGCFFANYAQFCAAGKSLLKSWAVEPTHSAKSLNCFYSQPYSQPSTSTGARTVTPSLKDIKCPFRIRYTFVNSTTEIRDAGNAYPNVLKPVRITAVTLDHLCELNIRSARVAKSKSKTNHPSHQGFQFFVMQMRQRPHMDSNQVRAALQIAFPFYVSITAQMAVNLRRKAINVIAQGIYVLDIDPMMSLPLSNVGPVAAESFNLEDTPTIRHNFGKLLEDCMKNSDTTWKTLAYLEHCRAKMPGFQFEILLNSEGCPMP